MRTPVIAALNGPAIGIGLTPALQADIRIVAADAKYGVVQAGRGVIGECASHWTAGERTACITLPAGSLPTNICIGGGPADELFVTVAHAESLLRIRLDERGDPPLTP